MPPVLANVYLQHPASKAIRTTPGRTVTFRGGHTPIFHETDIPYVLRMEDAVVVVEEAYYDRMPLWVERCGFSEKDKARGSLEIVHVGVVGPPYEGLEDLIARAKNPPEEVPEVESNSAELASTPDNPPDELESWGMVEDPPRRKRGRPRKIQV